LLCCRVSVGRMRLGGWPKRSEYAIAEGNSVGTNELDITGKHPHQHVSNGRRHARDSHGKRGYRAESGLKRTNNLRFLFAENRIRLRQQRLGSPERPWRNRYRPKRAALTLSPCVDIGPPSFRRRSAHRWEHPTLGLLAPVRSSLRGRQTRSSSTIGEWVLREVCRQNKACQGCWLSADPPSAGQCFGPAATGTGFRRQSCTYLLRHGHGTPMLADRDTESVPHAATSSRPPPR